MSKEMDELLSIVYRLRKECPWDREQTHESLRQSFLEETYEAIESIDRKEWEELKKELGDVLLHVVLQSAIADERKEFSFEEVVSYLNEKLIRRHPHVFGNAPVPDLSTQKDRWEKIKITEGRTSVIDGVPKTLPALQRAQRLQEKASKVGFDWNDPEDVWKKIAEETNELKHAKEKEEIEQEFGDLLFTLVNYSRFIDVDPENALRGTCEKFIRRFHFIESELKRMGKTITASSLEEMDEIWNRSKNLL
jgi:nucleoside triphosphate diphosphatase